MSQQAAQLHLKHPGSGLGDSPGLSIWDVPGSGLYRVRRPPAGGVDDEARLVVETLSPFGWVELIDLAGGETGGDHEAAMRLWIAIQTPVRRDQEQGESDG